MKWERGRGRTLFVACGEDDGAGLVANEALGEPSLAEVDRGGATLLQDRIRVHHLRRQSVTARPRLQLLHLCEHRHPQAGLRRTGRRRFSASSLVVCRRHSLQVSTRNPNPDNKRPQT